MSKKPLNIAHRGASSLAPENTMAAFRKAIECGCDGIELDVQFSKDGKLIVMHDEYLNRTTNMKGLLCHYTYDEIKNADAGSWFLNEFSNEPIPTLEEVLILAKEHSLYLNIELKTNEILYEGIEQAVINFIVKHDYFENIIISSFNHYSLYECKKLAPHIKTGILYMDGLYEPWNYAQTVMADAIHPYYINILNASNSQMEQLHRSNLHLNPFTVNDEQELQAMIDRRVTGIITDVPHVLKKILDSAK